jgi:hypothetical protein
MRLRRAAVGLVTLVMAAGTVAAGQAAANPNVYYDMYRDSGVAHQVVAQGSSTTSVATPDVYYDM